MIKISCCLSLFHLFMNQSSNSIKGFNNKDDFHKGIFVLLCTIFSCLFFPAWPEEALKRLLPLWVSEGRIRCPISTVAPGEGAGGARKLIPVTSMDGARRDGREERQGRPRSCRGCREVVPLGPIYLGFWGFFWRTESCTFPCDASGPGCQPVLYGGCVKQFSLW